MRSFVTLYHVAARTYSLVDSEWGAGMDGFEFGEHAAASKASIVEWRRRRRNEIEEWLVRAKTDI